MKMVKSLLLGSAAGLVAVTVAQAADLPYAEPAEYVKVCDTFGKGYFYIPGTQTCLQISGYVRADLRYQDTPTSVSSGGAITTGRDADHFFYRTRARLNFDARTQTEYGTLRAYIRLQSDFSNNNVQNSNSAGGGAPKNTEFYAEKAFVQFAGFTIGLSQSFFDMLNYTTFSTPFSDTSTQVVAYTATFGSGMSFTLAAEDRSYRETTSVTALAPAGTTAFGYGGTAMPDVVAAFRVDQGWGSFQLSGALHQLRPSTATGVTDTEYGFAVQAGLKVLLPQLAPGDNIWVQGVYTDGAVGYLAGTGTGAPWTRGSTIAGGLYYADATITGAGSIETTKGFVVGGGFQHFWTPTLRSSLLATYTDIDSFGSTEDFTQLYAAGNIVWSPVKDLDVGLEVFYTNLLDTPATFTGPEDRWGAIVRVQRNF